MKSKNPATGKVNKTYKSHSQKETSQILNATEKAFNKLKATTYRDRCKWMHEIADHLEDQKAKYAALMTDEMGKLTSEAMSEVEKCAWVCRFYGDHASDFLKDEIIETDAKRSYISYHPIGPVLAVMPWNFPFWQVFRFAAPTLMAGNTGVLKHASNVPQCALAIEKIFESSGFPKHSFRTLLVGGKDVEKIIAKKEIRAVTLTGSGPAGSAVAKAAGKHLKKSLLELGGSDPYLILEDADIDLAVNICVNGRLLNCGQSCIGAKRFIVVGKKYDEFLAKFSEKMRNIEIGDPTSPDTDLGPMASLSLRDELHQQITDTVKAGANLLLGGKIPGGKGAYYPPTILTRVKKGMRAYGEELFGPAAVIYHVSTIKEGIKIANDTSFGLGACVISRDIEKAESIAKNELEAGACFVNSQVKSDPRLPFGGIKDSGYGRELAVNGIKEFVNVKTVYVA